MAALFSLLFFFISLSMRAHLVVTSLCGLFNRRSPLTTHHLSFMLFPLGLVRWRRYSVTCQAGSWAQLNQVRPADWQEKTHCKSNLDLSARPTVTGKVDEGFLRPSARGSRKSGKAGQTCSLGQAARGQGF